jgi:probable rRNA maturation factor
VAEPQRVRLQNRQRKLRVDRARLRALVEKVLADEAADPRAAVTIVLLRDGAVGELNARFRGVARPTDVLAFAVDPCGWPAEEPPLLGDVVVSTDRAVAQAHERGISPERELSRLVTHGLLHLLGYEDDTASQRARMRRREDRYLREMAATRRR